MSTFVAEQIMRAQTIHLPAAPDEVFPLFSPLGETRWEPDWNPTMLYPTSGAAQVGTVFTTQHGSELVKIWTIISYDLERTMMSYLNLAPASHLTRIDIACAATGPQTTSACVSYTLTALTPHGVAYLDNFTTEHYRAYIASWETAITHYLTHGQAHTHPHA
ncbi:MAG TPA: hypothetical protein VE338_16000 [Ktedonobacterales bacterium]|jgi:hypothetical protein|nr:hypothetical protein [Ktedonobacterales bacterium]